MCLVQLCDDGSHDTIAVVIVECEHRALCVARVRNEFAGFAPRARKAATASCFVVACSASGAVYVAFVAFHAHDERFR